MPILKKFNNILIYDVQLAKVRFDFSSNSFLDRKFSWICFSHPAAASCSLKHKKAETKYTNYYYWDFLYFSKISLHIILSMLVNRGMFLTFIKRLEANSCQNFLSLKFQKLINWCNNFLILFQTSIIFICKKKFSFAKKLFAMKL